MQYSEEIQVKHDYYEWCKIDMPLKDVSGQDHNLCTVIMCKCITEVKPNVNLYTNLKISSDTLFLQLKLCFLDNRDKLLFTYAVTIDAFKTIPVHTSHYHHLVRIKTGNFGHQVNSDIHLQTVEIRMRRLLMSRLIRIFSVCLANLFLFQ